MTTLKKEYAVTEVILRVGVTRVFFFSPQRFPLFTQTDSVIPPGEQSWPRSRQTSPAFIKGSCRSCQRSRQEVEEPGRERKIGYRGREGTCERKGCVFFASSTESHSSVRAHLRSVTSPAVATPTTPISTTIVRSAKTDNIKAGTGDNTRDKCVELLYDALASDASARTPFSTSIPLCPLRLLTLSTSHRTDFRKGSRSRKGGSSQHPWDDTRIQKQDPLPVCQSEG